MTQKRPTEKMVQFAREYLVDLCGSDAAIRAGYSARTAKQQAYKLLNDERIQALIRAEIEKRAERTKITQDRVLDELAKIGFSDIRKVVAWGHYPLFEEGNDEGEDTDKKSPEVFKIVLVNSEDVDDDTAAAISEISETQSGVKIKMYDKKSALVDLGRHLGLFPTKVEHSGPDGKPMEMINREMTPEEAAEAYAATVNGES